MITILLFVLQARKYHAVTVADLSLRLRSQFDEPRMRKLRADAASALQNDVYPNQALSELLDWLSQLAYLDRARLTDRKLVHAQFSFWVFGYWTAAAQFLREERKVEPKGWKELERFVKELERVDKYEPARFLEREIAQGSLST